MTVLSNAAMWALIVGFLSPIVIQQITKLTANSQVQSLLAFVFCAVAGAGTAYFAASLTLHDWVKSSLVVFITAITTYEHLWKPLGVTPSTTGAATRRVV